MRNAIWELSVMSGKNPAHTGSFMTGYDHREFTPVQVAAREGCQNSMDAGRDVPGITKVVFQRLQTTSEKKEKLLDLFALRGLFEPRLDVFAAEARNSLLVAQLHEFLTSDRVHALLIRDYNTCGLGGKWDRYEKGDHFARLVCALNLDDKADGDENSAGSYGLGKTNYARSSNISTVIYHSTFAQSSDTDGAHRRLMGLSVLPRHTLDGVKYGGYAFFGAPNPESPEEAKPFENQDAAEVWNQLSDLFDVDLSRDEDAHGTDILILMDCLDLNELKVAVEDYYFPALLSHKLSVSFIDETGAIFQPTVRTRDNLDQFVRLYEKASGSTEFVDETSETASLNKRRGYNIGRIAFEAAEPDEAKSERRNCVAIMRGTGMVINYVKMGRDQHEPAVGVFIADKDVYKFLVHSENAAHSVWSENNRQLAQNFPEIGKEMVSHVNSVVQRRFIKFQEGLYPDEKETRSESGLLAQLLTKALSGSKGDNPVPAGVPNPVSLHLTQQKRAADKSVWNLRIEEWEHTPPTPFKLTLLPSISLAGDARMISIKHMDFTIKDQAGNVIETSAAPRIEVQFSPGDELRYTVEFPNPGNHNYLVQCKCIAEGT